MNKKVLSFIAALGASSALCTMSAGAAHTLEGYEEYPGDWSSTHFYDENGTVQSYVDISYLEEYKDTGCSLTLDVQLREGPYSYYLFGVCDATSWEKLYAADSDFVSCIPTSYEATDGLDSIIYNDNGNPVCWYYMMPDGYICINPTLDGEWLVDTIELNLSADCIKYLIANKTDNGDGTLYGGLVFQTYGVEVESLTIDKCIDANTTAYDISEGATIPSADYEFTVLKSGDLEVSEYYGDETAVTIPSEYLGMKVVSIGENAFYNRDDITSVTIPSSVTSIGQCAFRYCESLTRVTIPNSVTAIDSGAFANCTGLKSIEIPGSVKSIGDAAFSHCENLTDITIPSGITSIGDNLFEHCKSLTGITIPNGVTSIGGGAFWHCESLSKITIPDSVKTIGVYAFSGCTSLTEIKIPDGVTSIGASTFERCEALSSVTIPDSVTSFGDYAFFECHSLKTVTIPEAVTSIGNYAFLGCEGLESITIPKNVTTIGEGVFEYCESLASITVNSANKNYTSVSGVLFNKDTTTIICYPAGKTSTTYTLPSTVKNIGEGAFLGCTALNEVVIPNGIKVISEDAFASCKALTSVTLPESVTTIETYAFYGCESLVNINIPDSVTSIGRWAFLSTAICKNQTTDLKYVDNWLVDCDTEATAVVVKSGTKGISENAFNYCTELESVVIPESVIYIAELNFYSCDNATILCYRDSKAHSYAVENEIPFLFLPSAPENFKMEANSGSSIRLVWSKVAEADGYILEQYKNGTWVRIKKFTSNATLKYSVPSLKAGTEYKFRIRSYATVDGKLYYSDFADTVTACTKPAKVTAKEDAVSGSSVRLTWNKVTGASGYIIQQYKNGQWVRVAKVTSPDTLKYSVTSLKSGTTYKFRVQAYKMLGGKAYYGAWSSTVTTSTNPAKVTAKVDATSKSSVRLAWNKVTGASGYIVEQYKNGQWVRVAKVTGSDTLKYSVTSLKSGTTYKFRVRAYRTLGSKAYYGSYSATVTANTK